MLVVLGIRGQAQTNFDSTLALFEPVGFPLLDSLMLDYKNRYLKLCAYENDTLHLQDPARFVNEVISDSLSRQLALNAFSNPSTVEFLNNNPTEAARMLSAMNALRKKIDAFHPPALPPGTSESSRFLAFQAEDGPRVPTALDLSDFCIPDLKKQKAKKNKRPKRHAKNKQAERLPTLPAY